MVPVVEEMIGKMENTK